MTYFAEAKLKAMDTTRAVAAVNSAPTVVAVKPDLVPKTHQDVDQTLNNDFYRHGCPMYTDDDNPANFNVESYLANHVVVMIEVDALVEKVSPVFFIGIILFFPWRTLLKRTKDLVITMWIF